MDGSTELGNSHVSGDFIVFEANGSEWFEVRVNKQNMGSFDVNKGWSGVSVTLFGTKAHNVLNSVVKQLGSHNHPILWIDQQF